MKKKLHILLLVLFVASLGFITACGESVDPLTEDEMLEINLGDLDDVRYDSDEEDSIIDPFGGS